VSDSSQPLPDALSPGVESRPGLLRALGPGMALAMVVGNVIGSGIFLKPGGIARDAGDFSLIITAWIVGGVVCIFGALCFAELAAMLPRAGGLYVYLREAYGRPVAFLYGWSEFLFGKPASIGALSVAFVGALMTVGGWTIGPVGEVALALSLIVAMAWINIVGVIWGGRVQAGTTLIKAGFLGLVALLPFVIEMGGGAGVDWANYATSVVPKQTTTTMQFAAAMLAVMWAYNGWHGVTPVAEEVRDPGRNIPLALFGGIGILILLYVSANCAYHGVLTMLEMSASGETAAQTMIEKLLMPRGESVARFGVAAMSAVIMCSVFGAINSNMLNGPRVSFAMGRDDVFFRGLGRVHVNYRTPAIAIFVQAVMSSLLVIASAVLVRTVPALAKTNIFGMLTDYVIFSASIFYVLAVLSVFVLRRKHPEWDRPFRTLGYPVIPIAYVSFYAWFLSRVYLDKPFEAWTGIVLISLGLPVFYGWKMWSARHPEDVTDGQ
jgi:APA family basic amino acid/polyamine antiporter